MGGYTVPFALLNLDNGLFLEKTGSWTIDRALAQSFKNTEAVFVAASHHKLEHAAAALLQGQPPQVRAFFWISGGESAPTNLSAAGLMAPDLGARMPSSDQ